MSPLTQTERQAYQANIRKSYIYSFLMDFSLTAPIWVLYLRDERGFSLARITLLEVPLFLLIVFAEIPTGAVADRFGRKFSLMLSSGILALALWVYGIASSYPIILISNLAWGLAFTFRSGADTALLYDSLKQTGREENFQRINSRFWALRSAAMLGGLLLGAPIAAVTSYTFAITLNAVIAACALPIAFQMQEPKHTAEPAHEPYLRTLSSGVRDAWRMPTVRYIFLYSGIVGAAAAGPLKLLQQPWLNAHGVSTADLALWQAPVQAAEIFSALAAGGLLVRLGERRAFFVLPATLCLCGFALAAIDRTWAAAAFLGIALVQGLHNPILASYINRRIESQRRATILSVQSVVGNISMACAWPLAGIVSDAFRLQAAFLMYACTSLFLGGGVLLLWGLASRRDSAPLKADQLQTETAPVP